MCISAMRADRRKALSVKETCILKLNIHRNMGFCVAWIMKSKITTAYDADVSKAVQVIWTMQN